MHCTKPTLSSTCEGHRVLFRRSPAVVQPSRRSQLLPSLDRTASAVSARVRRRRREPCPEAGPYLPRHRSPIYLTRAALLVAFPHAMPSSQATAEVRDMEEGSAVIQADDGGIQLRTLGDLHRLLEEEGGAGKGRTVIVRSSCSRMRRSGAHSWCRSSSSSRHPTGSASSTLRRNRCALPLASALL